MALRLQAQYPDDLAIVFVESQGHAADEIERFAFERKWFGGRALWTSERPVVSTARGLPNFVLLDTEGRRILEGNSIALASQIEDAIAAQIASKRKGPADVRSELRTVSRDLLRGRFATAALAADKVASAAADDAELAAAAVGLAAEARRRAGAQLRRVGTLIERGYLARAAELLGSIDEDMAGDATLEQGVATLEARLDSDELETERKAERALLKLEAMLHENGADGVPTRAFAKLAERYDGTRAAERAVHLAALLGG